MSTTVYTVASEVDQVGYHGDRRNALADIFENMDISVMNKLCLKKSRLLQPQSSYDVTCCGACVIPAKSWSSSATGEASSLTDNGDKSHHFAHSRADNVDSSHCSTRVSEKEPSGSNGSSTMSTQSNGSRVAGSCQKTDHVLQPDIGSAAGPRDSTHRQSSSTTTTTTQSEKEKTLTRSSSSCSDQNENFHSMAGFRPEECAKRSLVF